MATRDTSGRRRPGMFETIRDDDAGLEFTPTSGRGNVTQFKVTGPNATGNPDTIVSRSGYPSSLAFEAETTGAAKPRTYPNGYLLSPPRKL